MELDEFKQSVADAEALLKAMQKIIPKRVDQSLIDYLANLQKDPCGLEVLRNLIASQKG